MLNLVESFALLNPGSLQKHRRPHSEAGVSQEWPYHNNAWIYGREEVGGSILHFVC